MNLFYFLTTSDKLCNTLEPIMTLVGYVIYGIKVVVPVILIVMGMIDLTRAIMQKDDSEIKKAQVSLVKKLVVGVCVYLVITIVGLIMQLINADGYENCVNCAFDPFGGDCTVIQDVAPTGGGGGGNQTTAEE